MKKTKKKKKKPEHKRNLSAVKANVLEVIGIIFQTLIHRIGPR